MLLQHSQVGLGESGRAGRVLLENCLYITLIIVLPKRISETSKVEVLEVEKRSREYAYFGSFRVRVNRDEFEKALAPECWPSGWSVREYFVARKKPEADQQGQNSQNQTNSNRS